VFHQQNLGFCTATDPFDSRILWKRGDLKKTAADCRIKKKKKKKKKTVFQFPVPQASVGHTGYQQ
jgi:hypothetical protein